MSVPVLLLYSQTFSLIITWQLHIHITGCEPAEIIFSRFHFPETHEFWDTWERQWFPSWSMGLWVPSTSICTGKSISMISGLNILFFWKWPQSLFTCFCPALAPARTWERPSQIFVLSGCHTDPERSVFSGYPDAGSWWWHYAGSWVISAAPLLPGSDIQSGVSWVRIETGKNYIKNYRYIDFINMIGKVWHK